MWWLCWFRSSEWDQLNLVIYLFKSKTPSSINIFLMIIFSLGPTPFDMLSGAETRYHRGAALPDGWRTYSGQHVTAERVISRRGPIYYIWAVVNSLNRISYSLLFLYWIVKLNQQVCSSNRFEDHLIISSTLLLSKNHSLHENLFNRNIKLTSSSVIAYGESEYIMLSLNLVLKGSPDSILCTSTSWVRIWQIYFCFCSQYR